MVNQFGHGLNTLTRKNGLSNISAELVFPKKSPRLSLVTLLIVAAMLLLSCAVRLSRNG